MTGITNGIYRVCEWVFRFAYVNLLWAVFTLVGLGLFGFMPATTAMFAVIRKWVLGDNEVPIFSTFWGSYRREFVKANLLGIILFIIGYLITIEFQILIKATGPFYYIARFGVIAQFILYIMVLMYFFPVFVHFKIKIGYYFNLPFMMCFLYPVLTMFLLVTIFLIHYLTFIIMPGLIFFFGGSVTAFLLMWGSCKVFPHFQIKSSQAIEM
ncbi:MULTISPECIES: YesL family protein [Bacillus]|uniref:YesL family protein n=1 Tax=Bacillus TaxID=1386 RepID=UPI000B49B854|nr:MULTISPECIES: YesL family protein [Bacillus]PGX09216.1 DUF624 domain-containing protein [Bacillus sp. AFS033286]